ncbi:MAG: extracellular solute-binding protein [Lachnospiraceae bacterium]|jgi:maltose-binding protein MalE|nr:extracellular solute-binding protein [Lachnospiraceae bacterium]
MTGKSKLWMIAALLFFAAGLLYVGHRVPTFATMDGAENETSTGSMPSGIFGTIDEKQTLYFAYSDESLTAYIEGASAAYGEHHNVRVIPQLIAEGDFVEAIHEATMQTNEVPDLYLLNHDSLEKAYLAGLAAPIHDSTKIVTGAYFPQTALSAVTYQDKLLAYPFSYETSILLYNKTYLREWALQQAHTEAALSSSGEEGSEEAMSLDEEAVQSRADEILAQALPTTVNDILNIANTFDVPQLVDGVFLWDVSDIFYNYWFVGSYMQLGGEDGDDRTVVNINNPEAIASLEVYQSLNQFFSIASDTVSYDSILNDFLAGKSVFTIVTTDAVQRLANASANGEFPYEYGFSRIPNVSDLLQSRSMSVTQGIVVNGYSTHKEEANQFAAFLATEYAQNMYEKTGMMSAALMTATASSDLSIFLAEYESGIPLPKMMEASNYWLRLELLFSKVWNGGNVPQLVEELSDQILLQLSDSVTSMR